MIINFFRKLRNKLTGLNATTARFDILQNKIDALSAGLNRSQQTIDSIKKISEQFATKDMLDGLTGKLLHALDRAIITTNKDEANQVTVNLQPDEAIRVVFLVQHPSIWPSWRSAWMAANNDSRFIPKVVLTPFIHPFSSEAVTYDDMRKCLINENVPFCTAEFFDVNTFRPHVVFVQNPYEDTRPEHFKIEHLKTAGARIAYIPYGLEMGGGAWNIAAQFDSPLHRSAWRIFARSERHKKMFGKYCRAGNDHVVVTGHPKIDSLITSFSSGTPVELTQKIAGRRVVLWTPHFSVGDPPTWSTYKLYGEFILTEMRRRRDLFLLIRPHPMFFQAMRQHKVWDVEGEQGFRQAISNSNNMALDENPDYHMSFSVSDALMTDVGSFLLEYLPTGKPFLYLHHPNGLGMNDDGDLVHYLYLATDPKDIADFVNMVGLGEDPLKSSRERVMPDFLFGLESSAGERICRHIYEALSAGDS